MAILKTDLMEWAKGNLFARLWREVARQTGSELAVDGPAGSTPPQAGSALAEDSEFDLCALAEACVGRHRPLARASGLELGLILSPDVAGEVRGDRAGAAQILDDLIARAVKSTGAGRIRIHLTRDTEGACLLEVSGGQGFDPGDLGACREGAERMGGRLTAYSQKSRGSVITVTLALPPVKAAAAAGQLPPPARVAA